MSSPNYSDFLIDYIDQLTEKTTVAKFKSNGYGGGYNPFIDKLDNLVLSSTGEFTPADQAALLGLPVSTAVMEAFRTEIDSISEVNQKILSRNNNDIELDKKDIYNLISTLSLDELSMFSPKIEIWRRLPSYMSLNTEKSLQSSNFIYKKIDFIDGWKQIKSRNGTGGLSYYELKNRPIDILNGYTGLGVAAIVGASWAVQGATEGLQGGPEIYDYLNKIGATIPKFEIEFKFDSVATFFGNSQSDSSQLITDFMKDPKSHLKEMANRNIEGNEITRNYAYLMFFGDINERNTTNQLNDANNQEAYKFLIKVGYEPVDYSFDDIIQDSQRRNRLNTFNQFLKKHGDYFNLIFKAYLGEYAFEFAVDNSIKLKCKFIGVVQQGAVNELVGHRRKSMNYLKVLEDKAIQDMKKTGWRNAPPENPNIDSDLQAATETVKNNQQLIDEYEILAKSGCDSEIVKDPQFKESLQKDLEEAQNKINGLRQRAWTYFLDSVPVHIITAEDSISEWTDNVISKTPLDTNKTQNLLKNSKAINTTNSTNGYSDTIRKSGDLDPEKIKEAAANPESSGTLQSSEGTITIPFFFFGDLVNTILSNFKSYYNGFDGKEQYQDLLCTMPNIEILQRSINTTNEVFGFNSPGRKKIINAAYVPIGMNIFRLWTYRNIISKQRSYYHLFDLLNDLKSLLTEAINYKTKEIIEQEPVLNRLNGKPVSYSTFYQTSFDISDKIPFSDFFVCPFQTILDGQVSVKIFSRIQKNETTSTPPIKNCFICGYTSQSLLETTDALAKIFQSKNDDADKSSKNITSAGDYLTDMKLGIAHFYIGNQMGLAKQFTFSSNTPPKQAEQQTINDSRTTNNVRAIQYNDVDIKLAGGNFFRPTELIYVHPHYTFGEPFDRSLTMSNILNIGGYYQVTEINSTFSSDGKYETTLKAKYLVHAQAEVNKSKCETTISDSMREKYESYKQEFDRQAGISKANEVGAKSFRFGGGLIIAGAAIYDALTSQETSSSGE